MFVSSTDRSTILSDYSTSGPCNSFIGGRRERQLLKGTRSGSGNLRDFCIWEAFYTRDSQKAVDAVYCNMGLLNASVDPCTIPPRFEYLGALIKMAQIYLRQGGRAHWLAFMHGAVVFAPKRNILHPAIYTFPVEFIKIPEWGRQLSEYFHYDETPQGWMDDLGYVHVRLKTLFLSVNQKWWPLGHKPQSPLRHKGVDCWGVVMREPSSSHMLVLAKHAVDRWHIHDVINDSWLDCIRTNLWNQWEDMDLAIGGPNLVYDLFDPTKRPRQEINVSYQNGKPILLQKRTYRFLNDEGEIGVSQTVARTLRQSLGRIFQTK